MLKSNHQIGLLIALIILIVLPLPITIFPDRLRLFVSLAYSFLIITGINACADDKKQFTMISVLGGLGFLSMWLAFYLDKSIPAQWLKSVCLLAFFSYLAIQIFLKIAKNKVVDLKTILASISGYLLIGTIGGLAFQLLTLAIPGSFKGLSGNFETYDLQYFSYITLTTVGFGDISPATEAAQSVVVLLALSGQIYLTILVAILVGKYLAEKPAN